MMCAKRRTWQDVKGWWLAEKFDGVRAFWDGTALRTRTWREISAPAWFLASLPHGRVVDGELWAGRGRFQIVSELARFDRSEDAEWKAMRLMAFDCPDATTPFEERLARVAECASTYVAPVAHRRCRDLADAEEEMRRIVREGGEGVMVKKPGHVYQFCRSPDWLKIKPGHLD